MANLLVVEGILKPSISFGLAALFVDVSRLLHCDTIILKNKNKGSKIVSLENYFYLGTLYFLFMLIIKKKLYHKYGKQVFDPSDGKWLQ